ncbi:MAG TPA: NUDIX domain-containing protein [Thermoplasmata archaeon]|nr:NUDIX domain-containing protein [Thermoplasmata archaeon]
MASAFLRRGDRFLFLHRGPTAPTHPGLWHGVSGRVEGHEDPADCALREIQEETGLAATEAARGDPLYVRHRGHAFRIHPFLFDCPSGEPRLNFENTEALWLTLAEVTPLPTVPRLRDAVLAALHAVPRSPGA